MNRSQMLEYVVPFMWACFSNMVWLYDVIINSIYSKYHLLNNKSAHPVIVFVKNGDEFYAQSGLKDDYDFILYKDHENDMIQIFHSVDDMPNYKTTPILDQDDSFENLREKEHTCHHKLSSSSVQFLTAEIQLPDAARETDSDTDDWVFMQIPKQLYVSGNTLFSKAFLLWYINKYTSAKTYNQWHDYIMADEYQVSLLDSDVKNSIVLPNQHVLLSETCYEIKNQ
jgi:hypothetical protein